MLLLVEKLASDLDDAIDIPTLTCKVLDCGHIFSSVEILAYHFSIKHPRRVSSAAHFRCLLYRFDLPT
jgi:ribosomal protein L18E